MKNTPAYLKPGDTIAIVCPAGYMAMEKVTTCISTLESWGFKVKVGTTVGSNSSTYFSGSDEERINDFQAMLDDKEVKAILCGRGGYGTSRIIDKIDFKKFSNKPKWIIGYSDITVLHSHLYSSYGIPSIHAPMAAAFNDDGYKNEYVTSLRDVLEGKKIDYKLKSDSFNRQGKARGELVGGNLSILAHLVGTDSDIKTKNRILFLEDIGEYSYNIDRMMHQLKRSGKLSKLEGLIIGGFTDIKDTERPFGKKAIDILRDAVSGYDYPVCYDFPVSHTERNFALKIGFEYKLNVGVEEVRLVETR